MPKMHYHGVIFGKTDPHVRRWLEGYWSRAEALRSVQRERPRVPEGVTVAECKDYRCELPEDMGHGMSDVPGAPQGPREHPVVKSAKSGSGVRKVYRGGLFERNRRKA